MKKKERKRKAYLILSHKYRVKECLCYIHYLVGETLPATEETGARWNTSHTHSRCDHSASWPRQNKHMWLVWYIVINLKCCRSTFSECNAAAIMLTFSLQLMYGNNTVPERQITLKVGKIWVQILLTASEEAASQRDSPFRHWRK